jgi:PAS domain S-box-containing protein
MDVLGLFSTADFMPHGHCYLWSPAVLWLHVLSDALIFIAYATIPVSLIWLVRKRRDIVFDWMLLCFGTFILACGATHAMEIVTVWTPVYWASGAVKVVTAVASIGTAFFLVRLLPTLRSIPSVAQLTSANLALEREVAMRASAERELREGNERLEARVAERTAELERALSSLRASEERYRTIVETADEGIWVVDGQSRTTFANRRLADMLGCGSEGLGGRPMRDFMDEGQLAMADGKAPRAAGERESREFRLRRRDGSPLWTLMSTSRLRDGQGNDIGALTMVSDISELKRNEERLAQLNADLERRVAERTAQVTLVNHQLEGFSYSLSHDLRAPLRAIDGFSRAVSDDWGSALDEEGRQNLERVWKAAAQMSELIDGMLALARLTQAEISRERVDISALSAEVVAALRIAEPARQVEVRIAAGLVVQADTVLVRAVLENLIGNAWKFTGRKPQPLIEVAAAPGQGPGVIMVRDNGAGFDMAFVGKLFVAFKRLHKEQDFPGTGIGLATVKRILDRHGGRVWVEAALERGATFYLDFARNQAPGLAG